MYFGQAIQKQHRLLLLVPSWVLENPACDLTAPQHSTTIGEGGEWSSVAYGLAFSSGMNSNSKLYSNVSIIGKRIFRG